MERSGFLVVGRTASFFYLAMLFLYPLPDDFRTVFSLCVTALVKLGQRFFVEPYPEHKVFWIIRNRPPFLSNHQFTSFQVAT